MNKRGNRVRSWCAGHFYAQLELRSGALTNLEFLRFEGGIPPGSMKALLWFATTGFLHDGALLYLYTVKVCLLDSLSGSMPFSDDSQIRILVEIGWLRVWQFAIILRP